MDFTLSDDQRAIWDAALGFAQAELAPHSARWDEEKHFPVDVLRAAAGLGFAGIYVTDDVGGSGLGRLDADDQARLAGDLRVRLGVANGWTRMLDAAARNREPGTVALLAGIGMQTGGWRGVPPEHLYHIVSALRRSGLDYYARMIAAEALARS